MTENFVVTSVGGDRPGIVAAVTRVLFELGCNLADCSMVSLRGEFAMMMLVEGPGGTGSDRLQLALAPVGEAFGLSFMVTGAAGENTLLPGRPYVVSIYGADRPGIVFRVSEVLAERHVNINALSSHLTPDLYTMVLDIDLPPEVVAEELEGDLRGIAETLQVEIAFRASESDLL